MTKGRGEGGEGRPLPGNIWIRLWTKKQGAECKNSSMGKPEGAKSRGHQPPMFCSKGLVPWKQFLYPRFFQKKTVELIKVVGVMVNLIIFGPLWLSTASWFG